MRKLLLALVTTAALSSSANAAVIISENFEGGPGVFTLNGNVGLANGAIYQPCCGTPPDTSNTFVAFGGGNDPSGNIMSSSFATVLGQLYTVTFDYGALGAGTEPLTFQVGGLSFVFNPVADNSLVTTFQNGSFSFAGTGGLTSLTVFSGGVDNVDAIVDNITVADAVPEPSTWAMMLFGFGAVGYTMRRTRRRRRPLLTQVA